MFIRSLLRIVYALLCFALVAKAATAQQQLLPTKAIDLEAGCPGNCLVNLATSQTYNSGTSSLGPQTSNFTISAQGYILPAPNGVVSVTPPSNALAGGFTIAVQMGPVQATVENVFSLMDPNNNLLFSLLRDNQGHWYFGKERDNRGGTTPIYYTQGVWDPISPCITEQGWICTRDTIYASFQTNGQIKLDEVAVLASPGSSTADTYNWQSGLLNFGYPLNGYNEGALALNPVAPLQQWPLGSISLQTLQASQFSSSPVLRATSYPQAQVARLAMWSALNTAGPGNIGVLNNRDNGNQGIALDQTAVNASLNSLPQVLTPVNASLNLAAQANWLDCSSGQFQQPILNIASGAQYWPADLQTPCNVPSAPQNITITSAGGGAVSLNWQEPKFLGNTNPLIAPAIQNYQVSVYQNGSLTSLGCTTTTTSCTISGLQYFATYKFAVAAQGTGGTKLAQPAQPATPILPATPATPAVIGYSPAAVVTYVSTPTVPSPPAPLPAGTPSVPGVVANVTTINTGGLLSQMNNPSSGMTAVAAHRGYWINDPENSGPAIQTAFNAGVEVVEVDLRASADGVLVVSHDADLIKETTGTGVVSSTPWSTISKYSLRDRKGNARTDLNMLQFGDVLNILNVYSDGAGHGPVIIADIKDRGPAAWNDYLQAVNLISSTLPAATRPAVLLKMPMNRLPSTIAPINAAFTAHPTYGHLVIVVNPEDATSGNWTLGSSNFQQLFALTSPSNASFVNQFELNINNVGDGATQYLNGLGGQLTSFATYYESKFYPEGVSTIYGGTTDTRNFNPSVLPPNLQPGQTFCCYRSLLSNDLRGLLPFSLFYNQATHPVSLITTDNIAETLNFLVSMGQRNVSKIQ